MISDYETKMIEAFVDKDEVNAWYQNAFAQYNVNGVAKMTWVWSWWAFFGGIFYLLYRKAYMYALGLFVLSLFSSLIPFGGLALWIFTGGLAPYFVYKTYLEKKERLETTISDEVNRIETMRALGGYNRWAVWLAVAIHVAVWGVVFYMIGTLIPLLSAQ